MINSYESDYSLMICNLQLASFFARNIFFTKQHTVRNIIDAIQVWTILFIVHILTLGSDYLDRILFEK
jgi:hypothetical protein